MVSFGYTILYVTNVLDSVVFYENTFGFKRKLITPENDYAELETGQTTISFASKELAHSNLEDGFIESNLTQKPFATELGMVTTQVQEIVELALKNGATQVAAPKQKPWGQTVAYIRDLDGFLIEVCSPMG
jgi:uncharacterized glyoxalase superfamily protein PhnB